jgi:hypothetical protein
MFKSSNILFIFVIILVFFLSVVLKCVDCKRNFRHTKEELKLTKVIKIAQTQCHKNQIPIFIHSAARSSGKYFELIVVFSLVTSGLCLKSITRKTDIYFWRVSVILWLMISLDNYTKLLIIIRNLFLISTTSSWLALSEIRLGLEDMTVLCLGNIVEVMPVLCIICLCFTDAILLIKRLRCGHILKGLQLKNANVLINILEINLVLRSLLLFFFKS